MLYKRLRKRFLKNMFQNLLKKRIICFFLRYSFLALRYGMRTMFIKLNSFIIKIDH
jgi:hypothetical protein